MRPREIFIAVAIVVLFVVGVTAIFWTPILWSLIVLLPLLFMGIKDISQKRQAIKNNFPVLGRLRYLLESFRPEIQQYFVETET